MIEQFYFAKEKKQFLLYELEVSVDGRSAEDEFVLRSVEVEDSISKVTGPSFVKFTYKYV